MQALFDHLTWENQAHSIVTFHFRPQSRYRYEAGQYAVIDVPHAADDRGTSRTMTLSSSPNDPLLAMTMRVYKQRMSSFKQALLRLKPGDPVTIYDAMGDLVLPMDKSIPLVFVAGGVGIASFAGIMRWLLQQRQHRTVSLHYAVSSSQDIAMQAAFDNYADFNPITKALYASAVSGADTFGRTVQHGRLNAADIIPGLLPESLVYLSGTEKLVEDVLHQLEAVGKRRQQIVFDYFEGYNDYV